MGKLFIIYLSQPNNQSSSTLEKGPDKNQSKFYTASLRIEEFGSYSKGPGARATQGHLTVWFGGYQIVIENNMNNAGYKSHLKIM